MSTRATIQFKDRYNTFYVYRHCDGFPENILPDIETVVEKAKGRWSDPECGMLVSFFLGTHFKEKNRMPDYEMTSSWHGDESYRYHVEFDANVNKWTFWDANRKYLDGVQMQASDNKAIETKQKAI